MALNIKPRFRINRSINDGIRAMIKDSEMPRTYWADAVKTVVFLQNRLSSRNLNNKTPFEKWTGKISTIGPYLKPFGSKGYAYVPKEKRRKLDDRGTEIRLLGYSETQKGYKVITKEGKVFTSRSITWIDIIVH